MFLSCLLLQTFFAASIFATAYNDIITGEGLYDEYVYECQSYVLFKNISLTDNNVVIEGELCRGTLSDISLVVQDINDNSQTFDSIVYFNQTKTDIDGNFKFEFQLNQTNTDYKFTITTQSGNSFSGLLSFNNKESFGIKTSDIVYFGKYPQSRITATDGLILGEDYVAENVVNYTYNEINAREEHAEEWYYKIEPIKWRVLSSNEGKLTLISEDILYGVPYNTDWECTEWCRSSIREWLNYNFADNAFSEVEKEALLVSLTSGKSGFTMDKVLLLSEEEAINEEYGFSADNGANTSRIAKNTDYLRSINYIFKEGEYEQWWLKSSGERFDKAMFVNSDGSIDLNGTYVDITYIGVRPLIKIDLNKVLFAKKIVPLSYENSSNPSVYYENSVYKIIDNKTAYKLTILDMNADAPASNNFSKNALLGTEYNIAYNTENKSIAYIIKDNSKSIIAYNEGILDGVGRLKVPLIGLYKNSEDTAHSIETEGTYYIELWFDNGNGFASKPNEIKVNFGNLLYENGDVKASMPINLTNAKLAAGKYKNGLLVDIWLQTISAEKGCVLDFENVWGNDESTDFDEVRVWLLDNMISLKPLSLEFIFTNIK